MNYKNVKTEILASVIKSSDVWNWDCMRELCKRAKINTRGWNKWDGGKMIAVTYKAAEILNVDIY